MNKLRELKEGTTRLAAVTHRFHSGVRAHTEEVRRRLPR